MKVKALLEVLQKAVEQGCGDIELSYWGNNRFLL